VPGLHHVKYGSTIALSDAQVRANIIADLNRLRTAGTLPIRSPKFEVFSSHSPVDGAQSGHRQWFLS
jgi:hypothetical protein